MDPTFWWLKAGGRRSGLRLKGGWAKKGLRARGRGGGEKGSQAGEEGKKDLGWKRPKGHGRNFNLVFNLNNWLNELCIIEITTRPLKIHEKFQRVLYGQLWFLKKILFPTLILLYKLLLILTWIIEMMYYLIFNLERKSRHNIHFRNFIATCS